MAKNFNAWPEGWPRELNYPDIPICGFLDQTAARAPNRLAVIFGGMELTFAELKNLCDRFAAALDDLGVKKGDRVALHLLNIPQFVIAYYGLLRLGAVFTPLNPLLSPREAVHQLNDCGAETIVSLDLMFPGVQPILKDTPVTRVITTSIADCYNAIIQPIKPLTKIKVPDTLDMAELLAKHQPFEGKVAVASEDLAHIAYTGGTTGVSKGVMLTHAHCVINALQAATWFVGCDWEMKDGVLTEVYPPGVRPGEGGRTVRDTDVALVVAPWFHAMGTTGFLNAQVAAGNTMVVYPRFDPAEYIGGVAKYKATLLGGAPQLYIPMVNMPDFDSYDLSGVKAAISGAAPLAGPILDRMLDAFSAGTVCEAYGLTECTMMATMNPPHREHIRHGSVGLPTFDTEMKVVDPVTGDDLPPGSEGEICIKGPQVMPGYWNRPEATAEVLTADGWLLTGDIGREDEDGFFFITDRKKDLILYKGYNVYPRELEELIFEHPAVEQCAVVGQQDLNVGEMPVAFVQLKQGAAASEEDVMAFVNGQVVPYKKLRKVIFMDAIPVSAAGKVLRKELRESLKREAADG